MTLSATRKLALSCLAAGSAVLIAAPVATAAPMVGRNFSGTGSTESIAYTHAVQNASNAGWGGCSQTSASKSGSTWTVYVHCVFTV